MARASAHVLPPSRQRSTPAICGAAPPPPHASFQRSRPLPVPVKTGKPGPGLHRRHPHLPRFMPPARHSSLTRFTPAARPPLCLVRSCQHVSSRINVLTQCVGSTRGAGRAAAACRGVLCPPMRISPPAPSTFAPRFIASSSGPGPPPAPVKPGGRAPASTSVSGNPRHSRLRLSISRSPNPNFSIPLYPASHLLLARYPPPSRNLRHSPSIPPLPAPPTAPPLTTIPPSRNSPSVSPPLPHTPRPYCTRPIVLSR